MKDIIYAKILYILLVSTLFCACADDKGNYIYDDKEVLTIEMPTQITALAFAEDIHITPTITSNLKGDINLISEEFEVFCHRKNSDNEWVEIGEISDNKLHIAADLDPATYTCRFSVINKSTGVRYSKLFYIDFLTTTTEGWMVLCNEGQDKRVRLDMLSQLSFEKIIPAFDVLNLSDDLPEQMNGVSLGFYANRRAIRNKIVLMSETGSYLLPTSDEFGYGSLSMLNGAYDLKNSLFLAPSNDHIIHFSTIACQDYTNHEVVMTISKEGNAFVWNVQGVGAAFEYPVNTSVRGGDPEYRVEPYVGTTLSRYTTGMQTYGVALLYDKDNKRFIGWDGKDDKNGNSGRKQTCYPLSGSKGDNKLFSYQTGLDIVTMLNTLTTTHAILQDGNKRVIYSINIMDNEFRQEGYYTNIQAPEFNNATSYAASSQYPVIYYACKNKVYSYNYATNEFKESISLPTGEEVTLLKFNRYDEPQGVSLLISNLNEAEAAEFRNRENELIVGSYNSLDQSKNGGVLRFYQTSSPGLNLSLKPGWEFKGYARIVDVKYKEVRR